MNRLRCLIIFITLFASSSFAQTNKLPEGYEEVFKSASAGDWRTVWSELEKVGILVVQAWDALMSEAIRQDDDVAMCELVQRARAAEIIEQSTQFSVCPVTPNSAGVLSARRVLRGGQEQVEFDPQALTPIELIEIANNLDTEDFAPTTQRTALLDEVATVLDFDALN